MVPGPEDNKEELFEEEKTEIKKPPDLYHLVSVK